MSYEGDYSLGLHVMATMRFAALDAELEAKQAGDALGEKVARVVADTAGELLLKLVNKEQE